MAVVVPSPAMSLVFEATSRYHLRAHVLELVVELDFFGDGYPVLGDAWSPEGLVKNNGPALRPERYLDRIGECVDAAHHTSAGIGREFDLFGSHLLRISLGSLLWLTR